MRPLRFVVLCALLASLALAVGCGDKLIPVEGTVTVGKGPLKKGDVTYHPDREGGNTQTYPVLPSGKVDENGKYVLSTGGKPGAPPGKYKVTVTSTEPGDPKDPYSMPRHLIDKSHSAYETTKIKIEVKGGAPAGQYDITLEK